MGDTININTTPLRQGFAGQANTTPLRQGFAGQANLPAGGQLGSISVGKELEPDGGLEQPVVKDVSGQEIELPKEVAAAGVKVQPTTVQLPQPVAHMGVQPVGQATPPPATTVALPLTDDQIAKGLKLSITSSWRWLAEWCVRKLKQLHKKFVKFDKLD